MPLIPSQRSSSIPQALRLAVVVAISQKISRVGYSAEVAKARTRPTLPHAYRYVGVHRDARRGIVPHMTSGCAHRHGEEVFMIQRWLRGIIARLTDFIVPTPIPKEHNRAEAAAAQRTRQ